MAGHAAGAVRRSDTGVKEPERARPCTGRERVALRRFAAGTVLALRLGSGAPTARRHGERTVNPATLLALFLAADAAAARELPLDAALAELDRQSLTLVQARSRAAEASAVVRQSASALLPTLSVQGTYLRNSDGVALLRPVDRRCRADRARDPAGGVAERDRHCPRPAARAERVVRSRCHARRGPRRGPERGGDASRAAHRVRAIGPRRRRRRGGGGGLGARRDERRRARPERGAPRRRGHGGPARRARSRAPSS